jgi:hypothetical protein
VPFDRSGGKEQPGADIGVRQTLTGQLRDLNLLRSELIA